MRPSPNLKGIIMIRILRALEAKGTSDIHEIRDIVGLSISRVRELVKLASTAGLVEGQYLARLDVRGDASSSTLLISYTGVLDDRAQRLIAGALTLLDTPAMPGAATASA